MGATCPTCGRKLPAPRKTAEQPAVNTANMSDRELFAYYKRTAHAGDVKFMLHHARMSPELAHHATLLYIRAQKGLSRSGTLLEHAYNLMLWRIELNAAERAEQTRENEVAA